MLDVVGVGTNSVDEVLQLPEETGAVLAGGKVRVSDRRFMCGGQTATVMARVRGAGPAKRIHRRVRIGRVWQANQG